MYGHHRYNPIAMAAFSANDITDQQIMQLVTRRAFIGTAACTALAALSLPGLASATKVRFKVGVTDWNLKLEGKIESISLAKQLGFDGLHRASARGKTNFLFPIPRCRKHFWTSRSEWI